MAFSGLQPAIYAFKKNVKNKFPLTRWPLKANLYYVHKTETRATVYASGATLLRKATNIQGDDVYILKKNGDEILAPHLGAEDPQGGLTLVRVGEGSWLVAHIEPGIDVTSFIMNSENEEVMRYQYANLCKEAAFRYSPEEKWYQTGAVYFLIMGLIMILAYIVTTTSIGTSLGDAAKSMINAMQANTDAILGFTKRLPSVGLPSIPTPPA